MMRDDDLDARGEQQLRHDADAQQRGRPITNMTADGAAADLQRTDSDYVQLPDRLRPMNQLIGNSSGDGELTVVSEVTLEANLSLFRGSLYPPAATSPVDRTPSVPTTIANDDDDNDADNNDTKKAGGMKDEFGSDDALVTTKEESTSGREEGDPIAEEQNSKPPPQQKRNSAEEKTLVVRTMVLDDSSNAAHLASLRRNEGTDPNLNNNNNPVPPEDDDGNGRSRYNVISSMSDPKNDGDDRIKMELAKLNSPVGGGGSGAIVLDHQQVVRNVRVVSSMLGNPKTPVSDDHIKSELAHLNKPKAAAVSDDQIKSEIADLHDPEAAKARASARANPSGTPGAFAAGGDVEQGAAAGANTLTQGGTMGGFFRSLRESTSSDPGGAVMGIPPEEAPPLHPSTPGAYPMDLRPGQAPDRLSRATTLDVGESDPEEGAVAPTGDEEGLAVANAVDEEALPNLPHAMRDWSNNASGRIKSSETVAFLKKACCVGVCLILALNAVVWVIIGVTQNDSTNATNSLPQEPMSMAPTSFEDYNRTQAPLGGLDERHVLSLLPEETLSLLGVEGSAQAQALDWLLEDIVQNPHMQDHQIQQRFSLATLFYSTDGERWLSNDHWLSHTVHECSWFNKADFAMTETLSVAFPGYLAGFFPATEAVPPRCNAQGLYLTLWLDTNNLVGSLPLELYMLTSLQTMSFSYNQLEGQLTSNIGKLSSLEGLFHFGLKNGGNIPSEIGLLSNLRGLGLYSSQITGDIPTQLWQLTHLEVIALGGSHLPLKGSIPSTIGSLRKLKWIHIIEAELTGSIPSEIGTLGELEWLALQNNYLTGTLPTEIGGLTKTTLCALWDNALTGAVPTELGAMTSLSLLTFAINHLDGTIPSEVGLLTHASELLDFAINDDLHGVLPTELGLLTDLEEFSIAADSLAGTIPSELGLLSKLEFLGFARNSLSGTIPNELSASKDSLYLIEFNQNPLLSGTVPNELCGINNTCVGSPLRSCLPEHRRGLNFDCTEILSGCGCEANESNGTTLSTNASPQREEIWTRPNP